MTDLKSAGYTVVQAREFLKQQRQQQLKGSRIDGEEYGDQEEVEGGNGEGGGEEEDDEAPKRGKRSPRARHSRGRQHRKKTPDRLVKQAMERQQQAAAVKSALSSSFVSNEGGNNNNNNDNNPQAQLDDFRDRGIGVGGMASGEENGGGEEGGGRQSLANEVAASEAAQEVTVRERVQNAANRDPQGGVSRDGGGNAAGGAAAPTTTPAAAEAVAAAAVGTPPHLTTTVGKWDRKHQTLHTKDEEEKGEERGEGGGADEKGFELKTRDAPSTTTSTEMHSLEQQPASPSHGGLDDDPPPPPPLPPPPPPPPPAPTMSILGAAAAATARLANGAVAAVTHGMQQQQQQQQAPSTPAAALPAAGEGISVSLALPPLPPSSPSTLVLAPAPALPPPHSPNSGSGGSGSGGSGSGGSVAHPNPKRSRPTFFMHLHKAAGTTLCELAVRNGQRAAGMKGIGTKALGFNCNLLGDDPGHLGLEVEGQESTYGQAEGKLSCKGRLEIMKRDRLVFSAVERWLFPSDLCLNSFIYITCLRDPVKRIKSSIKFHREQSEALVTDWATTHEFFPHAPISKGSPSVDNFYVRSFAGKATYLKKLGLVTAQDLEEAQAILEKNFEVVLIVEQFSRDLVQLEVLLGWKSTTLGNAKKSPDSRKVEFTELQELVLKKRNALDYDFYKFADEKAKGISAKALEYKRNTPKGGRKGN
jgi:hypothetical protein